MKTKNIFIIYSEHQARVNLRAFYESDGHYVVSSGTATDALVLLQQMTPPDSIIIGGVFPYLTVTDFVNVLKSDPLYRNIPISIINCPRSSSNEFPYTIDLDDSETWLSAINH